MEKLLQNENDQDSLIQQLRDAATTEDRLRIVDEWNKKIEDTYMDYGSKENEIIELKKTIAEIRNMINDGNGRLKSLLRM